MFILLFGVSGVGKSTLINELTKRFGWQNIPTYMTRPLRDGEVEKLSISKDQFYDMESAGHFITVNNLFGNLYGTPVMEVQEAVNDAKSRWVLDFPISKRHLLERYKHTGVVVLPESLNQLKKQVRQSGREERLTEILEDYAKHYAYYQVNTPQDLHTFVVVNSAGREIEVAAEINKLIENET